jgi:head-tail adaptor
MSQFKYFIKDKQIKIYRETDSGKGVERQYIHPKDSFIKAYIRQLSSQERYLNSAEVDGSEIEIVINQRDVHPDMYIVFKDKHYQIGPLDRFEFYNTEVKFRAREVTPRKPQGVTDQEWNV